MKRKEKYHTSHMKINQATSTATLRSARAFISSDMISAISLNKCVSLSLLLIQHVWAVGLQSHWLMTCMERCSSTWDARAFNANSGVPAPENSVQSCTWTGFFWASQQSVKKTLAICSGQWNNCFNGVSVIVMSSGLTSSSVSFFSLRCFFGMRTDATLAVVFFVALGALDLLPFLVVFASFFCFLFDVVLSTPKRVVFFSAGFRISRQRNGQMSSVLKAPSALKVAPLMMRQ